MYRDGRATTPLAFLADADDAHCCPAECVPAPSPTAITPPVLGRAPPWLHSRTPARQTASSPACAAATHRECLLVPAAPPPHPGSPRSLIPGVRPPTHPRGHWPSSWPDLAAHLGSTPLLPLLYRCDTMPSSSSS